MALENRCQAVDQAVEADYGHPDRHHGGCVLGRRRGGGGRLEPVPGQPGHVFLWNDSLCGVYLYIVDHGRKNWGGSRVQGAETTVWDCPPAPNIL